MKKYQVVIWLSCVVVVMAAIKLTYQAPVVKDEEQRRELVATLSPTPTTNPVENDDSYPLWNLLPYEGKGFTVDHYVQPGVVVVYVAGVGRSEVKTEVDKWMEDNGVDPDSQVIEWR